MQEGMWEFIMFAMVSHSPEETADIAAIFGQKIREGTVVGLVGDLGAGKTLFVQSLAKTLGVEGDVTSPSFSLMNIYEGICPIVHFDLYRLEREEELEDIGFFEYTDEPEGLVLVEWPDKFPDAMPEEYVLVEIAYGEEKNERRLTFRGIGEECEEFVKELEDFAHTRD